VEFNLFDVVSAVAKAYPDREALVFGDRRLTAGDFLDGVHRFADVLLAAGLQVRNERAMLANHESGQPHVAVYLRNCPEYMEATIGCFAARAVPLNINYRYVASEVAYLLNDGAADAVVYASEFAETVASAVAALDRAPTLLLQVDDGSHAGLLPGARWYHEALARATVTRAPDDLYGIYTGGTTGRPKVVLWRQADAFCPLFGGRQTDGNEWDSIEQIVVAAQGGARHMPVAPFMHAAGLWPAVRSLVAGNTLIVPPLAARFDADAVLDVLEAEQVQYTNIVGDAFIWPVVDALRRSPRALSTLRRVSSGGTAASPKARAALLELVPHLEFYETVGASETGAQIAHLTTGSGPFVSGSFTLLPRASVLAEDRTRTLDPAADGDAKVGWIVSSVRVPLGYLGDAAKSAETFPVMDGRRLAVSGDRVRLRGDGLVDLLGRDSGMINTGGEKVFAEEVERSLLTHPAVHDAVVCGRPSERWGSEVVAIISCRVPVSDGVLQETVRSQLAAYKVPRSIIRVDEVRRGPNAKVDLAWARNLAATTPGPENGS
jgi:3-oxocholest-4-en-26-oate---CoA ligase